MPKTRGGRGRTARMLAICGISLRGGSHQGQKRRLLEKLEGSAEISDLQDENVLTSPKSPRLLKPFSTYTVNAKGIFESTLMSPVPLKDLPVLNDTARNISESSCELPVVVTSFSQGSKIINNTAMQSDVQENSVEIHLEKTDDLIQPEIPEILPVGEMIESTKKGNIFEFECELPVAISSSILQEVPVIIDSEVQENSVELHLEKTDDLIQLETETVIISKIPDIFPVAQVNQKHSHKLTEYFVVRKSIRKTKKQVLREQQRSLEDMIRNEVEVGLESRYIEGKGRGVFATKNFEKGAFVVEYSGDFISSMEANEREDQYAKDETTGCYMYYFKYHDQTFCIDATRETGKLGRLINHSRTSSNLYTKTVLVDGLPRLVLLAKEHIKRGQELLYDYGDRSRESLKYHPWLKY